MKPHTAVGGGGGGECSDPLLNRLFGYLKSSYFICTGTKFKMADMLHIATLGDAA